MAPAPCNAPNCPVTDLKDTVISIDNKTDKIIEINTAMSFMSKEMTRVQKETANLFKRVSDLEQTRPSKKDLYIAITICAALFAIFDKLMTWMGLR